MGGGDNDLVIKTNEARVFFENEIENLPPLSNQKSNEGNIRKNSKKTLLWNEAMFKQLSFGLGIIIPFIYEEEYYVQTGLSKTSLDDLAYLLMYQTKKHKWCAEVVSTLPDETYQNSTDENTVFSGVVIVEDWHGNFIRGFMYKDGEVNPFVLKEGKSKIDYVICQTTDILACSTYTWTSGETETAVVICETVGSETICPDTGGGEDPGGSGVDPGDSDDYPPSGGGPSDTDSDPDTDPDEDPDEDPDLPPADTLGRDLNIFDLNKLNDVKADLTIGYCPNNIVVGDMWDNITFKINTDLPSAAKFYTGTNTIAFKGYNYITNGTVLEEMFHSFQNYNYPGGTEQYLVTGKVNIEFEACVYRDVWSNISSERTKLGDQLLGDLIGEYSDWLTEIAINGFSGSAMDNYDYWLGIFGDKFPKYNSPTHPDLSNPNAIMNSFECYNN